MPGRRFCAFAQRERDADAFRLSLDEVATQAVEAAEAGATEVCMQGGSTRSSLSPSARTSSAPCGPPNADALEHGRLTDLVEA